MSAQAIHAAQGQPGREERGWYLLYRLEEELYTPRLERSTSRSRCFTSWAARIARGGCSVPGGCTGSRGQHLAGRCSSDDRVLGVRVPERAEAVSCRDHGRDPRGRPRRASRGGEKKHKQERPKKIKNERKRTTNKYMQYRCRYAASTVSQTEASEPPGSRPTAARRPDLSQPPRPSLAGHLYAQQHTATLHAQRTDPTGCGTADSTEPSRSMRVITSQHSWLGGGVPRQAGSRP